MKKIMLSISLFVALCNSTKAQSVGIGTTTPDVSSVLEVKSTTKGFLPPRMTASEKGLIVSPKAGLLIYQTDGTPGLYVYSGTAWAPVAAGGTVIGGWSLTGNTGTNPATNFIGTTDDKPLNFRINNEKAGIVESANENTALGYKSLAANTATYNTAIGFQALNANTSGINNTAVGRATMINNSTGQRNTAMGANSMVDNTTGDNNTGIGSEVLVNNVSGANNTAVGYKALTLSTGAGANTAVGRSALVSTTTGNNNTAVGLDAQFENVSGNNNVAVGLGALSTNISGNNNTALGYAADVSSVNLNNATAIGAFAKAANANSMVFGSTSVISWAFGRTSTQSGNAMQVGTSTANGNGAFLTNGGAWTNASDSTKKDNITAIDGAALMAKLKQLPVTHWKYKQTGEYHIGPMAQDFYKLFQLGMDDKSISSVDPAGVALKAIQYQQTQIETLQKEVAELKEMIMKSKK